jgi:hypothetical protein
MTKLPALTVRYFIFSLIFVKIIRIQIRNSELRIRIQEPEGLLIKIWIRNSVKTYRFQFEENTDTQNFAKELALLYFLK